MILGPARLPASSTVRTRVEQSDVCQHDAPGRTHDGSGLTSRQLEAYDSCKTGTPHRAPCATPTLTSARLHWAAHSPSVGRGDARVEDLLHGRGEQRRVRANVALAHLKAGRDPIGLLLVRRDEHRVRAHVRVAG